MAAERKEEIIGKLNKDFVKPWFGWKKDGSIAINLSYMTYEETVLRMIRLMIPVLDASFESFKVARNDNVQAPMDFALVTFWKVISIPSLLEYVILKTFLGHHESIFPAAIDGDLLKLVHCQTVSE